MGGAVFWCGYNLATFGAILLGRPAIKWTSCVSSSADTLVLGARGPCTCNPTTFQGLVVSINGEDSLSGRKPAQRQIDVGVNGFPLPYGAITWVNWNMSQYRGKATKMAVAYANSNCVTWREHIAAQLAAVVPVHALGKCTAMGKAIQSRAPGLWSSNAKLFQGYAFVLAAEHGIRTGYVTEKPFVAAASGAIPIYAGDKQTAIRYLNQNRLILWNSTVPSLVSSLLARGLDSMRDLKAVHEAEIHNQMRQLVKAIKQKQKL